MDSIRKGKEMRHLVVLTGAGMSAESGKIGRASCRERV